MSALTTSLPLTRVSLKNNARVLLVDDNEGIRYSLSAVLRVNDFDVTTAASVNEALKLIASTTFDILLSDLHMPAAGDGLTVVSAMRHANPEAVTMIFSGYPEMNEAAAAILLQADEILVKPLNPTLLVGSIRSGLQTGARAGRVVESVAQILESCTQATITDWLHRIELEPEVVAVPVTPELRCAHLPELFQDIISRLRHPLPLGSRALVSEAAFNHGKIRRQQGYTAAMMVEESRMLQVSIFQTLQNNLHKVDFSLLLLGVMAIADEVDSQLAQAMKGYLQSSREGHVVPQP